MLLISYNQAEPIPTTSKRRKIEMRDRSGSKATHMGRCNRRRDGRRKIKSLLAGFI
jgi:hypothetical protein